MASNIRTLTEEFSSCTRSGCGTTSRGSTLASSTACIRLALSVGMYRDPSTAHRERGTVDVDVSYLPIVSSTFGIKLGQLPCRIGPRNLPNNLRSSRNFTALSATRSGVGSKLKVGGAFAALRAGKNFFAPPHFSFGPPF